MLRRGLVVFFVTLLHLICFEEGQCQQAVDQCESAIFEAFDTPPSISTREPVVYPDLALHVGLTGEVVLKVDVLQDGTVCAVGIEQSAHSLLTKSAVRSARRSIFQAARSEGRPVPGTLRCEYVFGRRYAATTDSIFGAEFASQWLSSLSAKKSSSGADSLAAEPYSFEEIEVRGAVPLAVFRWIQANLSELQRPGEVLHHIESFCITLGERSSGVKLLPVLFVSLCVPDSATGVCGPERAIVVYMGEESLEFGNFLHVDR